MNDKHKESIVKILTSKGLLTKDQVNKLLIKEDTYRARLFKARSKSEDGSKMIRQDISIVDIIDSLKVKLKGSENRYVDEELMMEEIAKHQGLPYLKIDPLKLDSDVVTKIISRPYALKHQLVPVKLVNNSLTIATSNPFEFEGIEGIKQSTNYIIDIVVSTKTDILKIITEFYGFKSSVAAAHEELTTRIDLGNLEQYVKLKSITELDGTDQHIINAVEYLLRYAYSQRASDIHIEPKRDFCLIRFRIDGMLHSIHRTPKSVHAAITSRIKTLARMNIAEKRKPQDGRIKTDQDGKEIELRVSTLPVAFGEKIVIRIFDPEILLQSIEQLGFPEREFSLFNQFIKEPHGLILVTGPTGSGKTTTLYSALKVLSSTNVNLTTIEDPIEMVYEEFNQTSVQHQLGLTFAATLRTILRQDPDIIMVGEIRDFETADNAIQAALTGHLVFSTLHTNDAAGSITRLVDLGVPAFLINSSLTGIVAQRLVRRICYNCTEQYYLSENDCDTIGISYEEHRDTPVAKGSGCSQCRSTGYLGRTGIFEIIENSESIKSEILKNPSPQTIKELARKDGLKTLRECAVEKMLKGITTFNEVIRVTGVIT